MWEKWSAEQAPPSAIDTPANRKPGNRQNADRAAAIND